MNKSIFKQSISNESKRKRWKMCRIWIWLLVWKMKRFQTCNPIWIESANANANANNNKPTNTMLCTHTTRLLFYLQCKFKQSYFWYFQLLADNIYTPQSCTVACSCILLNVAFWKCAPNGTECIVRKKDKNKINIAKT